MTDKENVKKHVTLYYADWCGHCKTFKPEWFKFKSAYNKVKQEIKEKYGIELVINEYENDANPEKATQAGVDGFPTIKIKYNDKTDDYIGPRTAKGLFKKLIQKPTDEEIDQWLNNVDGSEGPLYGEISITNEGGIEQINIISINQLGGANGMRSYGEKATDPRIVFANSYRKYLKYKKKCEKFNIA